MVKPRKKLDNVEHLLKIYFANFPDKSDFDKLWGRIKIKANFKPKEDSIEKPARSKKDYSSSEKRKYILEPLDEVILNPQVLDDVIIRCSIPDLIEKREPSYSGVILFGPPGTGKTILQRALVEVYQRAGAYSSEESLTSINSAYVGRFAQNLEGLLEVALKEARKRKKPSFISFDEGSTLVQVAEDGAANVSKHYQEAIDVLKKYIGNHKELVLSVSTNLLPDSFEDALTRDGRLTSFLIDYPQKEERMRLWQHFIKKYSLSNKFNPENLYSLAEITPSEQGAFIEEFCRNYTGYVRAKLLRLKGYSNLLEALKTGVNVSTSEIKQAITPELLIEDVNQTLHVKSKRDRDLEGHSTGIGFKIKK